ncbi:hypothetical protein VULLAG_LOCUS5149 [Vulpes lagopus]
MEEPEARGTLLLMKREESVWVAEEIPASVETCPRNPGSDECGSGSRDIEEHTFSLWENTHPRPDEPQQVMGPT